MNKNFNKLYIFGPVAVNSQSITLSGRHAALCQPDDFQECWRIQKVTGEVWIGLKQNIIDTAVNETRNHLRAVVPTLWTFFYCRQL